MADEKWIAGLSGAMSVTDAAKLVLPLRLGVVRDRLPAAVFHADDDIEHVHQLRVATRRAAAALRIFVDCLPARLHDKSRKALRGMRRAAGEARDWDVFFDQLKKRGARVPADQTQGLIFLQGYAHGQRTRAQEHLVQAHAAQAEKYAATIDEITRSLVTARPLTKRLGDLAGPMLTQLLHEMVVDAAGNLDDYDTLHQIRILGKRLRYAMEIFANCYPDDLRDTYYPAIVDMQDILGLANDSFVAARRLTALTARLKATQPKQWPRYRKGIETLLAMHEKRLPLQRKKFEKWWREWMKSGAEQAFADLIRTS